MRHSWQEMEREEARHTDNLTIEQSVKLYLSLCHSYAPMIEETRDIFLPEREAFLTELQTRLHKLAVWLQNHHGDATESS